MDRDGRVYVVDTNNGRTQALAADGKGANGWTFICRLSKGKYGTRIIVCDLAGNESAPGFGTLTVK